MHETIMGRQKIILALDVDTAGRAVELVSELKDEVGAFKVGLELFNRAGPGIFDELRAAGAERIFYDCKFHDIPNTISGASRAVAAMGIWMFNVHCTGGAAMMRAAVEAAREESDKLGLARPLVMGVTLLTSIDQQALELEIGVEQPLASYVVHLAALARQAGLDGVIASPHEIELIRAACGPELLIVTPGVRPVGAETADQKRVLTPTEAVRRGADYLVIGRPITGAADRVSAAREIAHEILLAG